MQSLGRGDVCKNVTKRRTGKNVNARLPLDRQDSFHQLRREHRQPANHPAVTAAPAQGRRSQRCQSCSRHSRPCRNYMANSVRTELPVASRPAN